MRKIGELADGEPRVISCDGTEIGVFMVDGELVARYNRCAHRGRPLCQARIYRRVVEPVDEERKTRMRRHDWPRFDLDLSGEIVDLPFLSAQAKRYILGLDAARIFNLEPKIKKSLLTSGSFGSGATLPHPRTVDLPRIEPTIGIAEFERGSPATRAGKNDAVEARAATGVAGACAGLLDLEEQHILIAIDAHLDDALDVARGLPFLPQCLARAAVVPGLAGRQRLRQRVRVHVCDHEDFAGIDGGDHTRDEARRVELGGEGEALLDLRR
jgi:nitrite reductase/ring-hydroxylating ferredoxin subunit